MPHVTAQVATPITAPPLLFWPATNPTPSPGCRCGTARGHPVIRAYYDVYSHKGNVGALTPLDSAEAD
ncbi:hypothetical protein DL768_008603 [Monosporascus sp. mg162]|nr:hypothetical protein DL768_008603 [Monosporascus sp. mg162]